ncbi:hypothetical protein KY290_023037 [Solanum tuberosum]|uniref:Uncharacterized protein n=1 Tax=Solanum tuberosum TaxID=4113 RepID=A0ABQ7V639_SOLTU|nr:hypothetical protein KY285_021812 [Solanum tuberosum]KAH0759544.1 hypothetical protein KY290_023037 [Solanum tuberosum]
MILDKPTSSKYKVSIQVNKYLANDGMRNVESPKPVVHTTGSNGLLSTELDR